MAAVAITLIEAATMRVLIALGIGVAADAANDATENADVTVDVVRERQEEADKTKATPIARAETQTKTKTKCQECAPDCGEPFNRPTAGWSAVSIAYQVRICGLPVGPGFITEWMFNGVTFDGFDSSQCLLKEAKAKYDQFFYPSGRRREFWDGHEAILMQATAQVTAAIPRPPVQLRWYFMESMSYRFFSIMFSEALMPIETVFQP